MKKTLLIIMLLLLNVSCTQNSKLAHKSFTHKIMRKKTLSVEKIKSTSVSAKTPKQVVKQEVSRTFKPTVATKKIKIIKTPGWEWPVKMQNVQLIARKNGIDILGQANADIYAARSGEVVYIGEALRGYGKLVIIKHDQNYITAYAHNDQILVKEGQNVSVGEKIATMGNTGADQVKLHFEVRHSGKPIDPNTVLAMP